MDSRLRDAQVPHQHRNKTLDDYLVDEDHGDAETKAAIEEYLDNLPKHRETGRGLLLAGDPGSGKTLLASIILQHALKLGFSGYFVELAGYIKQLRMMFDLKDAWSRQSSIDDSVEYAEWNARRRLLQDVRSKIELVVIDDVGKEMPSTETRFAEHEYDFLLRHRFNCGLISIVTSNVPVPNWAGRYNEAMESFVHEAFIVVGVEGHDMRKLMR